MKNGLAQGGGTPPFFPTSNGGGIFQRGNGGILPERGSSKQRDLVNMLAQQAMQSAQGSGSPLLAFLAPLAGGAITTRTNDLYTNAQEQRDNDAFQTIMGAMGGGSGANMPVTPSSSAPPTNIRDGIIETAQAIGADPLDLATTISYETAGTFDPTKAGPTTQWGQHKGFIQFGEPQAKQYGVNWDDPIGSQLGANGAVANYFRDNGYKEGMGLLDMYSIVNAGAPGRYNASDANNGGAPGTVADKVNNQMADHRKNAMRLLGGDFTTYANAGQTPRMGQDQMQALMGVVNNSEVSPHMQDMAMKMLTQAMQGGAPMSPQDQIKLAGGMLDLEQAMNPQSESGFRVATPEEAAQYGAQAGQFGPDGRFYPSRPTANTNNTAEAGIIRQRNEATELIQGAVTALQGQGYSEQEAMQMIARNPIYAPQLELLGIDAGQMATPQPQAPVPATQADQPGFWARLLGLGGDGGAAVAAPQGSPLSQPMSPAAPKPPAGFSEDF